MEGRKLPRGVANARTFNKNYVGPEVGQQKRRVRPGILLCQADNAYALKLQHDGSSSPDAQTKSLWILFSGL
jgi:hypothetical protein